MFLYIDDGNKRRPRRTTSALKKCEHVTFVGFACVGVSSLSCLSDTVAKAVAKNRKRKFKAIEEQREKDVAALQKELNREPEKEAEKSKSKKQKMDSRQTQPRRQQPWDS